MAVVDYTVLKRKGRTSSIQYNKIIVFFTETAEEVDVGRNMYVTLTLLGVDTVVSIPVVVFILGPRDLSNLISSAPKLLSAAHSTIGLQGPPIPTTYRVPICRRRLGLPHVVRTSGPGLVISWFTCVVCNKGESDWGGVNVHLNPMYDAKKYLCPNKGEYNYFGVGLGE